MQFSAWFNIYGVMTVCLITVFLIFLAKRILDSNQRFDPVLSRGTAIDLTDALMPPLMMLCTISIIANGLTKFSSFWDISNTVVAGFCMSWGYLRWACAYTSFSLRDAVACLALSYLTGSTIKIMLDLGEASVVAFFALIMPLISVLSVRSPIVREISFALSDRDVLYDKKNCKLLVQIWVCVFLFLLVATVCGPEVIEQNIYSDWVGHLVEIVLALIALVWVFVLNYPLNFFMLWRWVFLFFSSTIVCKYMAAAWGKMACMICNQVAISLTVMLVWILLTDISHHSNIGAIPLFAFGWAAYTGSRWAGSILIVTISESSLNIIDDMCGLWLMTVLMLFFFSTSNHRVNKLLSDVQPPLIDLSQGLNASPAEQCKKIAYIYGLTNRELDVFQLLAVGHSKAFIAAELSLSENTVRNHTKHIYLKLDIHSREELLSMVSSTQQSP